MTPIDNAHRHFLAQWIYVREETARGIPPFLWMCLREDVQAPYLERADALVNEWLTYEQKQEASRNRATVAIIGIDYDEIGYQRTVVKVFGNIAAAHETGDPVQDFEDAMKSAASLANGILLSSSCSSFVRDQSDFGWHADQEGNEVLYRLSDQEVI